MDNRTQILFPYVAPWRGTVCLTILATLFSLVASGQAEEAARRRNFNTENLVAMREFDPISYFKGPKPLKGNSKFYSTYKGITYYFANAENVRSSKSLRGNMSLLTEDGVPIR